MSLFTIDLGRDLTYQMVEDFLRVGDPETERPQENELLDFNENLPPDFGDVATAFANTYGGLVILGVKEKKGQVSIAESIVGIPGSQVAVQGKIVNVVWSTVQPRPLFSVGVVPVKEAPDRVVAVVRVEEGTDTPYMYIGGQKNKISVRIGDSNRTASLEHVRALFAKGVRGREQVETTFAAMGDPYVKRCSGEHPGERAGVFHQWWWIPSRPFKIRLDRATERKLLGLVQRCFSRDPVSGLETTSKSLFSDFDGYNSEFDYHRKWRFSDCGAVSFTSKIGRIVYPDLQSQPRQEMDRVGDWILDALSFLRLAREAAEHSGYFGSGVLRHVMGFGEGVGRIVMTATMPTRDPEVQRDMGGISIPTQIGSRSSQPYPNTKEHWVTLAQLDKGDTVEIVAESFLHHVRDIGGSVEWEKLVAEIRYLMDTFGSVRT